MKTQNVRDVATTMLNGNFTCTLEKRNESGLRFHPKNVEKSEKTAFKWAKENTISKIQNKTKGAQCNYNAGSLQRVIRLINSYLPRQIKREKEEEKHKLLVSHIQMRVSLQLLLVNFEEIHKKHKLPNHTIRNRKPEDPCI